MGSGRGDRNQELGYLWADGNAVPLQWGPVVVTGIRSIEIAGIDLTIDGLQWGPVVVTGIRSDSIDWGHMMGGCFNGVRSW